MKVKELLVGISVLETNVDLELDIPQIYYDSRKVTQGSLFVAVAGFATDGNRYIPMALEKGAVAVVTAQKPQGEIPYILVADDRLALAQLGANFYGHPGEKMTLIGVTGTNGKTSVTLLLKHILEKVAHAKVGLIGTMENLIGDEVIATERTTPESLDLQALFSQMYEKGCTHVVMEVSSHAIALERVGGVHFHVAAFTNLTEDHLDFHKTMENYCDTKAKLFERCENAVLNCDDSWFQRILPHVQCNMVTTSTTKKACLYAQEVSLFAEGVAFTAVHDTQRVDVTLPIPGRFTVSNALMVLGICLQLGISLTEAADALKSAQGVRGRVEVVPTPDTPYSVLIDYAHTPDGLENVLRSVRDFCKGRLIVVFGCGGDRDPIKRPIMGDIGTRLSDIAVITSDNPRTEKPMAIITDILKGVANEAKNYVVIENRVEAIAYALDIGQKDDIIVLAGKGHETYQEICGVKHPLDEREVVRAHLTKMRETNG